MSNQQLFIPARISVGFQKRSDTYTKKLAFVVYYGQKGERKKQKSWDGWRDKSIPPVDFDNVPTEGFVLNKGVGGARQSYGWNTRNEYIRVYDPRDFEFEISVSNLLFILRECDCNKGKGLEGKFVYAWDGNTLVLLPENSQDYQNSKKFTELQSQGVKAKEMIPGASYLTKKQVTLIYLGRFNYHTIDRNYKGGYTYHHSVCKKKHVFWDGKDFVFTDDLKSIAVLNSDTVVDNYAKLVEKYGKSPYGSKIVKLFAKSVPQNKKLTEAIGRDYWVIENPDGTYSECCTNFNWEYDGSGRRMVSKAPSSINFIYDIYLKDGEFKCDSNTRVAYPQGIRGMDKNYRDGYRNGYGYNQIVSWVEPTTLRLFAQLESGSVFRVTGGAFVVKER